MRGWHLPGDIFRSTWTTIHVACAWVPRSVPRVPLCPLGVGGRVSGFAFFSVVFFTAKIFTATFGETSREKRNIMTALLLVGAAVPQELPGMPVFSAGLAGVACYRIPSMIQTPASQGGGLIALAEARRKSCFDGDAREIAARTSVDGGASWGPVRFIVGDGSGNAYTNDTYWVGNPAAVVTASGRLLLMVSRHGPGCVGNCVTGNAITYSDDGGLSWSAPRDITASLGAQGKSRTGPGLALLLQAPSKYAGRILVPASTGTYGDDHVYTSDDGGATWAAPPQPHLAMAGLDEAQLAQLPNGSILILMRHVSEPWKGKAASISDDGGVTWGPVSFVNTLRSPNCQASLATIGNQSLWYSGASSTSHERVALTLRISEDGGLSWPGKLLVDPGPSGYSCLVPAPLANGGGCRSAAGTLGPCGGVLYEAAKEVLRFVRFPLAYKHTSDEPELPRSMLYTI
jgi:sialidase-1